MDRAITNPDYRCTCSNSANCTWGSHGFIPEMSQPASNPERLALFAEYEWIDANLHGMAPDARRDALIRQAAIFRELVSNIAN